ncbi:DUF5134 domain-containing protein [Streptomyces sp. ISL-12]|uniref:DUF5134 domain-containing protein n=1 Tax=Streptomyces sp. ISL-12 TaxID=2819177 RepID=UPI001BE677D1|nr:DUF5134 domain-containing protein [Streptomyces sp. ISL-12]MBT2409003.1 DUF5134 domain-containing protein [Streptomyces sp. ISL-12]
MWQKTPADLVHALLTVLFTLVSAHALRQVLRPGGAGRRDRVDHLLHAGMAGGMAVMPWGLAHPLAGRTAVAVCAAAALWFVLSAPRRRPAGTTPRRPLAGTVAAVAARLPAAAGMAAMAWMLRAPHGAAHRTLAAGGPAAHHTAAAALPEPAVTAVLAVGLLACGVRSLTRPMPALRSATDDAHRTAARDPYGHARDGAMALGTAVMLLLPH